MLHKKFRVNRVRGIFTLELLPKATIYSSFTGLIKEAPTTINAIVNLQLILYCRPDHATNFFKLPLGDRYGLPIYGLSLGVAIPGFHRYSGFAISVTA